MNTIENMLEAAAAKSKNFDELMKKADDLAKYAVDNGFFYVRKEKAFREDIAKFRLFGNLPGIGENLEKLVEEKCCITKGFSCDGESYEDTYCELQEFADQIEEIFEAFAYDLF